MTTVIAVVPERLVARDDYADVVANFVILRTLPVGSRAHAGVRERIVARCLPLAEHIARRYDRRGESYEDLLQVARVGLMNVVNRFDPDLGEFLGFAVPTIMGEVKRHFRDRGWSVSVPRRLKDVYPQIAPAVGELTQRLGRSPTASEIAAAIDVDREVVVEAMTAGAAFRAGSIDVPLRRGEGGDTVADRLVVEDRRLGLVEDRHALRVNFAQLTERERSIITMRFFEGMTQNQIASRIGVSQVHVSRLLAQALETLRNGMLYDAGDADDK